MFGSLWIAAILAAPADLRPMTLDDVLSMARVGDVAIAPNGNHVFYSERELNWASNRYDRSYWLIAGEGGEARRFVGKEGGRSFQFTPDGEALTFLRRVDGDDQVHLLRLHGGEAEAITHHVGGISSFRWSGNTKRLFFTAKERRSESDQSEWDKGGDAIFVGEGPNGIDADQWSHLWWYDTESGNEVRLTDAALSVESFDVSRDGTRVVFQGVSDNRTNYFFRSELYLVDVDQREVVRLTENDAPEERVILSPDATRIAYHSPSPEWYDLRHGYLWVMDLATRETTQLVGQHQGEIDALHWTRDGASLLFTESRGLDTNLYRLDVETDEVTPLTAMSGRLRLLGLSSDRRTMVYTHEDFSTPPDLYIADVRGRTRIRLTRSNRWIDEISLGKAEAVRWKSRDGTEIEGVLVLPAGRENGARLPLVMNIHGGPPGFYGNDFDPEFHVWAGRGYAAFGPNPRGSSSYGDDFLRALMGDVGGGEFDDLMTGVDHLIDAGVVDPTRLALRGWSWGGILGAWTITQTERFSAAALGAMVGDWFAETGGGLMFDLRLHYIQSEPYADPEEWRRRSALTYVANVTTPTLLLHGEKDDVSTVNQSMMFYTALRDRGIPTRFLKFPRQQHDIREPRLRRICDVEEMRWIEKYANGIDWDPGPFTPRESARPASSRVTLGREPIDPGWLDGRSPDATDQFFIDQLRDGDVPGMSAAVVAGGRTVWTGAYGWANLEARQPVTDETLFQIASVSKTITSFVVMHLVEQGKIDLDADINDILPFATRNPAHPDVPITLRQLLTHTASIRDNWGVLERTWVKNGDFPISLAASLRAYLQPGGAFYDADENFHEWRPGARYRYSNIGIALAAYIAEEKTRRSFESLCQASVFEPLKMDQSRFRLSELPFAPIAMPYEREKGRLEAQGHHGYLDFPAGCMRTSAKQLSRFLLSFIGDGELDGVRVLKAETVAEMRRVQFPELSKTQGLVWYWEEMGKNRVLGHDGGDPGVSTTMIYRPDDGVGVVLLLNGSPRRGVEDDLITKLFELGEKFVER